jgi:hypothetical protein
LVLLFQEDNEMWIGNTGFHPTIGINDFLSEVIVGYGFRISIGRAIFLRCPSWSVRAYPDGNQ